MKAKFSSPVKLQIAKSKSELLSCRQHQSNDEQPNSDVEIAIGVRIDAGHQTEKARDRERGEGREREFKTRMQKRRRERRGGYKKRNKLRHKARGLEKGSSRHLCRVRSSSASLMLFFPALHVNHFFSFLSLCLVHSLCCTFSPPSPALSAPPVIGIYGILRRDAEPLSPEREAKERDLLRFFFLGRVFGFNGFFCFLPGQTEEK